LSLNWKEIDLVLSELDLEGAHIERILQPSFDSIVFGLYKSGVETDLLVSIAHGACRIHALSSRPPKPPRPLRFQECLKSRIRGGRFEAVRQLGDERIIRIDISVNRVEAEADDAVVYKPIGAFAKARAYGEASSGGRKAEEAPEGPRRYRLYARLWSGAGNLILVDEDGLVVDAMARRPGKGEVSGEACTIEEDLATVAAASATAKADNAVSGAAARPARPTRSFEVRELPPPEDGAESASFNRRVEAFYAASGGEISREKLLETARDKYGKRRRILEARIAELEARASEFRDAERLRELGDILMANQHRAIEGKLLACDDFFKGGEVAIAVAPGKSVLENARAYYERYRKASSGLSELEAELEASRASLEAEKAELSRIEAMEDPLLMARALGKGGTVRSTQGKKRPYPGLSLERNGWTILVGRSAKENDELLRRHVKGQDLWMHARDYAGSYVFVKAKAGKSFPLEIMLDAGNLAIYYSKGRANGGGELYYTMVKHLRRAKDGPLGLVLPSQEKNLHVNLDEARLSELKALIGEE
jgi:predicted ribosome quality control (RQC) complex YloA/Tae2 family protein